VYWCPPGNQRTAIIKVTASSGNVNQKLSFKHTSEGEYSMFFKT